MQTLSVMNACFLWFNVYNREQGQHIFTETKNIAIISQYDYVQEYEVTNNLPKNIWLARKHCCGFMISQLRRASIFEDRNHTEITHQEIIAFQLIDATRTLTGYITYK